MMPRSDQANPFRRFLPVGGRARNQEKLLLNAEVIMQKKRRDGLSLSLAQYRQKFHNAPARQEGCSLVA